MSPVALLAFVATAVVLGLGTWLGRSGEAGGQWPQADPWFLRAVLELSRRSQTPVGLEVMGRPERGACTVPDSRSSYVVTIEYQFRAVVACAPGYLVRWRGRLLEIAPGSHDTSGLDEKRRSFQLTNATAFGALAAVRAALDGMGYRERDVPSLSAGPPPSAILNRRMTLTLVDVSARDILNAAALQLGKVSWSVERPAGRGQGRWRFTFWSLDERWSVSVNSRSGEIRTP